MHSSLLLRMLQKSVTENFHSSKSQILLGWIHATTLRAICLQTDIIDAVIKNRV